MSNHDAGRLLNEVLCILEKREIFQYLGKEETLKFLREVKSAGYRHDCNDYEILDDLGERLKICYECWRYRDELEDGRCKEGCLP